MSAAESKLAFPCASRLHDWRHDAAPTGSLTQRALVHVLVTGGSKVPQGAGADRPAADGVGVTVGTFLTGVADAGVVQVAEQPWGRERRFVRDLSVRLYSRCTR